MSSPTCSITRTIHGVFSLFDFEFGWSKACKCKKLIKNVQYRLNLLKIKRSCIVRHLRDDVAYLIRLGLYQIAFNRVEQIYKDECIVVVYHILTDFCECISAQLSYILRNKDCRDDIKEAISSVIFASARFGNLPELILLRKLFGERYGERFVTTALELRPGNHVNFQIREYLSMNKVPDEVLYKLFEEITKNTVQSSLPMAIEFNSEQHHHEATKGNEKRLQLVYKDGSKNSTIVPDDLDAEEEAAIYLYENIDEFRSLLHDIVNENDQRGFVFISSSSVSVIKNHIVTSPASLNKVGRRIRRKRLGSPDAECPIYYENRKRPDHQNHSFVKRRAMNMPCERKCEDDDDESGGGSGVKRSYSLPTHVHLKLPDYDHIVAELKGKVFTKPQLVGFNQIY